MLESTFRILREEIIDNYMMNDDTIALSVTDYGFLDTSTKPLRLRQRHEINEKTNLWLKPNFNADAGHPRKIHEGSIGFQTWPKRNFIAPEGTFLATKESTEKERNLEYKRCGDHGIVIKLEGEEGYYFKMVENSQLQAIATLQEATVFNVHRFKETLSTKMKGVNCSGWFMPELWSCRDGFYWDSFNDGKNLAKHYA